MLGWQRWKRFLLEMLLRHFPGNPCTRLAQGSAQPWHALPSLISPNPRLSANRSFASSKKKKKGKKRVCWLMFRSLPFLQQTPIPASSEGSAFPNSQLHGKTETQALGLYHATEGLGPSLSPQEQGVTADIAPCSLPIPVPTPGTPAERSVRCPAPSAAIPGLAALINK